MKRIPQSRHTTPAPTAARSEPVSHGGFWADFRAVVFPTNKWHYVFHAVVVAVALSYWLISLVFLRDASWAEIAMYRPKGDNQVWPVITAVSHLNFGDPTDALKYGQGIGGFHAVILLPHALAFAIFGPAGYMIADVLFSWCYFVALAMLFRCWGLSSFSGFLLSSALTTSALQSLLQKVGQVLGKLVALTGGKFTEWGFPDVFTLSLFDERIPRPFPTGILVTLLLYFFSRQWLERRPPTLKFGVIVGVLMGLVMQGDPYSFSVLGLIGLMVLVRSAAVQNWSVPWRFSLGALGGLAAVGWYFVIQMVGQHPDSATRFGLANYPRSQILILPGYGPWIRLLIVACLAVAIIALVTWHKRRLKSTGDSANSHDQLERHKTLAIFALAIVVLAWVAQPLQLLLLGKGAQIYHFLLYTLPGFYSYAVVLLLVCLFKALNVPARAGDAAEPSSGLRRVLAVGAGFALAIMLILGVEDSVETAKYSSVSRRDGNPWTAVGDAYRPAFRGLDKAFREHPELKKARSFATFCNEANLLLTAFHDKRAYLPDNAFTTLSDDELEQRLFNTSKLCQIPPPAFANMIQDWYTLNCWLGCAKYWCSSDYKFAPESDYPPAVLDVVKQAPKQTPFSLILPKSQFDRLTGQYESVYTRPLEGHGPDVLIVSLLLKDQGFNADPALYRPVYSNNVFTVFARNPQN